jgi:hypothetical protein
MKRAITFVILLSVIMTQHIAARAQDMDTELSKLAEDVASQIKDKGSKKVTVLDFTDLEGGVNELGKYVAEQLTVDLVMTKRDFSVLDRANLKRILDEHKLTATGLVDPENAKQLGKFAGVDTMIFGTIVPVGGNLSVAVKIITTEGAEVVGGAKTKFKLDNTVQKLLDRTAKSDETKAAAPAPPRPKPFGDLEARIESINLNPGDNYYGYIAFSIIITNTSATDTYGIALQESQNKLNLSNSRGEDFDITELHGIGTAFQSYDGLRGSFTDVLPGNIILITGKGQVRWNGKPGDYRPYRIQTEAYFGIESNGRYPDKKKINIVLNTN